MSEQKLVQIATRVAGTRTRASISFSIHVHADETVTFRNVDECETLIPRFQQSMNEIGHYGALKHDHFNTLRHQLAAVALNAMMEFFYAGLESEPDFACPHNPCQNCSHLSDMLWSPNQCGDCQKSQFDKFEQKDGS